MSGQGCKTPILRIQFESYDDFLIEYGERLRHGMLALPAGMQAGGPNLEVNQKVRVKLLLPNEAVLFLTGVVVWGSAGRADQSMVGRKVVGVSAELAIRFGPFSAEQKETLEMCIGGALAERQGRGVDGEDTGSRSHGADTLSILLVDDSVTVRLELGDALRNEGVRVRVAEHGLSGIAVALKRIPDVILSDVEMPVMDGWTFLRMARARARLASIPFVFFTRLDDELSRLQGYRLGVDDYLSKSLRPDEVIARLRGIVNRQRRERSGGGLVSGQSLRGDLRHVRLASLLSFLESERRSGRLYLENGRDTALLNMINGELGEVDKLGPYTHMQDRIFELLDWRQGEFEFVEGESANSSGAESTAVTYLLMEHARRSDEAASK